MEFAPVMSVSKTNCSVEGCHSVRSKNPTLRFHLLPKGGMKIKGINEQGIEELIDTREAWLRVCAPGKKASPYLSICSRHFEEADYAFDKRTSKRTRLKKNAIPTLNLAGESPPFKRKRHDMSLMGELRGNSHKPHVLEEGEDFDIVLKKESNEVSVQAGAGLEQCLRARIDLPNKTLPYNKSLSLPQNTKTQQTEPQGPSQSRSVPQPAHHNILDGGSLPTNRNVIVSQTGAVYHLPAQLVTPKLLPQATQPKPDDKFTLYEIKKYLLKKEINDLKLKLTVKVECSYSTVMKDERICQFYTGMPSMKAAEEFFSLFDDLHIQYHYGNVQKLCRRDQILMCLIKLRHNFHRTDLAVRFGVSDATVTNVILTWINIFHIVLFPRLSDIGSLLKNSAETDNDVVIDLTEVFCDSSVDKNVKEVLFSKDIHHASLKGLVGVSPDGTILYASNLYPGSIGDDELLEVNGVFEHLPEEARYLAAELPHPNADPHIPLPLIKSKQLHPTPGTSSPTWAGRKFEFGVNKLKAFTVLRHIPHFLKPFASVVFQTVAALANFQMTFAEKKSQKGGNETENAVENLL